MYCMKRAFARFASSTAEAAVRDELKRFCESGGNNCSKIDF